MNKDLDIVDFHSHILPGADHGSSNLETTFFQLQEAKKYGVSKIIATPHFYPTRHKIEKFLSRREDSYNKLLSNCNEDFPDIVMGAEVLICDNIEELPNLEKLFVKGTDTLLLELPFADFSDRYCDSVRILLSRGINVVLAHADRYPTRNIELMLETGVKLQLNANSLTTLFKRRDIYSWLERGKIIALGSDIHGKDKKAYKAFSKARDRIADYLPAIKQASDTIFLNSKKNI